MLRKMIFVGLCVGTSVSVPLVYEHNVKSAQSVIGSDNSGSTTMVELPRIENVTVNTAAEPSLSGRKVAISADGRGHYLGEFKINGRRVDALIDTGATAVALNLSTARRAGLKIQTSDMTHKVNTANGDARATVVVIDRVEIGRISVENVEAVILEDKALSTNLIGMTFLNRLKKFQSGSGTLLMVQ